MDLWWIKIFENFLRDIFINHFPSTIISFTENSVLKNKQYVKLTFNSEGDLNCVKDNTYIWCWCRYRYQAANIVISRWPLSNVAMRLGLIFSLKFLNSCKLVHKKHKLLTRYWNWNDAKYCFQAKPQNQDVTKSSKSFFKNLKIMKLENFLAIK